jgi:hypothetical protein
VKRLLTLGLLISTILLSCIWGSISNATGVSPSISEVRISSSSTEVASLGNSIILTARGKVQRTDNINASTAIRIPRTGRANVALRRSGVTNQSLPRNGQYRVVGNRNESGRAEPITPRSLDTMFVRELQGNGLITRRRYSSTQEKEYLASNTNNKHNYRNNAVADGLIEETDEIPVLNLLAIDEDSGELVYLRNIDANSFCVDALNAVIDDDLLASDYDLSDIDPDKL